MPEREIGTVLAVLRVARGLTQEDLAKASGVRSGSISDYECSRMIPGLRTLERLIAGMGYSLGAIEHAQDLIRSLDADASVRLAVDLGSKGPEDAATRASGDSLALRREVEEVAILGGKFLSRLIRLLFHVLIRGNSPG